MVLGRTADKEHDVGESSSLPGCEKCAEPTGSGERITSRSEVPAPVLMSMPEVDEKAG